MAKPLSNYKLMENYAYSLSGSESFGNLSYKDRVGYSYAEPVVNRLPNVLLVTSERWSNTTSKHVADYLYYLNRACGVPAYTLKMRHPAEPSHRANYEFLIQEALEKIEHIKTPRIRQPTKERDVFSALNWIAQYETVCHLFGADKGDYSLRIYDQVKTLLDTSEEFLVLHSQAVLAGYITPKPYTGEL